MAETKSHKQAKNKAAGASGTYKVDDEEALVRALEEQETTRISVGRLAFEQGELVERFEIGPLVAGVIETQQGFLGGGLFVPCRHYASLYGIGNAFIFTLHGQQDGNTCGRDIA